MGFLNFKETIFDITLTDKGRALLSKNQLNFKYYAFSDASINYSGSITQASGNINNFENIIFRNLSLETNQMINSEMTDFLYYAPTLKKKNLILEITPDTSLGFTGNRIYDKYSSNTIAQNGILGKPIGAVVSVEVEDDDRQEMFVKYQSINYLSASGIF